MRAYVLNAVNELHLMEVELRALKPGEALIEVHAAGVCESDIPRIFITGTYHFPTIPGHEFAGRVVEVGQESDNIWVDKKVGVFPLIPCRKCSQCKKDLYEMCDHYSYLGSRTDGGFAEYVIAPVWNLIELPDSVSYEEAAMLEPASVALHAVRRLGINPLNKCNGTYDEGDINRLKVLIIGLGTIAGIVAQWLAIAGVKDVWASGHHKEHGDLMNNVSSRDYHYVDAYREHSYEANLYDIVIDCVNSSDSLAAAIKSTAAGGQILILGNPHNDIYIDRDVYWKILRKQIRLTGTWNSTFNHFADDDWNSVLVALGEGKLKLQPFITHLIPFDELHKGLDIKRERKEFSNKVMMVI